MHYPCLLLGKSKKMQFSARNNVNTFFFPEGDQGIFGRPNWVLFFLFIDFYCSKSA